ncbi:TnsA-like heteromeric transposase endonuclease subunit [Streptomyces sp. ISL-43]|uniref:TnsA-like heteromeric transposase endonuclease subunit n=1 Tax=Streptomyces sp. ISL-43 TaxID=2819183 RepID=UPI001BEB2951|nr:TnsA-like heteromeric transposase endonuclease subunit [Streptomyces sp. ISL-43]MBT2449659.1 TnsA-like heteromeric transposase endonuclease subunit [Streptomyces sp. ISL-43]
MWSHSCRWDDLLVPVSLGAGRDGLDLAEGWTRRWTATWRHAGGDVICPVADLAAAPVARLGPMRGFTWRRDQRHRPGLEYMVSTGRLHGFESLEEAGLLLALDFAGHVTEVLSQPLRLKFRTAAGWRKHTPDFLAISRLGIWLIDVRPADLIQEEDRESFAATAEAALTCGWHYTVAAGWRPHVLMSVDEMSSRRRPLADPLGVQTGLFAGAGEGLTFGEIAAGSAFEPVARAHLLHLLWHRRLGVDLNQPLADRSTVVLGSERS